MSSSYSGPLTMIINCTETVPFAQEFLSDLTDIGLGLIISTGLATLFTLIFSAITCWFIYKNTHNLQERYISWLMVASCPVVGVTSYVGLLSPRSSQINILITAIYMSVSAALFFRLIMLYMGGEEAFYKNLKGVKVPLGSPPCCCCICLRNVHLKRQTLQRLKLLVYQSIVFRPILLYIDTVMKMEQKNSSASLIEQPGVLVVTVLTTVSTALSLLGLIPTFNLSKKSLKDHGIALKFLHIQLVMAFNDAQGAIFGFIANTGALPCSHIFYHPVKSSTLTFILLCYEMMLLSILGLKQYKQKFSDNHDKEFEIQSTGDNSKGFSSLDTTAKHSIENQDKGHN